jgi:hypothetical protein
VAEGDFERLFVTWRQLMSRQNFFQAICPGGLSGCQWAPDYLAIHVFVTSGQGFIDAVQGYRSAFPGLDIVVSEFACYVSSCVYGRN